MSVTEPVILHTHTRSSHVLGFFLVLFRDICVEDS
uniref:Uncharacterized protein n=1 Tax=Anguilla anguilla TaxID=7936 RepID=A0A0E9VKW1_ANGAN